MTFNSNQLIEDLIQQTKENLNQVQSFKEISIEQLNWKTNPESWSILECIEHLNLYGDFYLPEITSRIVKGKDKTPSMTFKSGWLGNYFAKSMLPKEKLNKMKTFKIMNPIGSQLDSKVLEKFISQQKEILDLLDKARSVNLKNVKTSISISNWIKLRLGDTFRVVIYHNYRHLVQAQKVLAQQ